MAKRVNIHVANEDVSLLERFKQKDGNASELFREALRRWGRLDDLRGEHELIKLDMRESGKVDKTFYGTWIWTEKEWDGDPEDDSFHEYIVEGVAQTRKGQFVHYWSTCRIREQLASYKIYPTVDAISDPPTRYRTEQAIIAASAPEFLDI